MSGFFISWVSLSEYAVIYFSLGLSLIYWKSGGMFLFMFFLEALFMTFFLLIVHYFKGTEITIAFLTLVLAACHTGVGLCLVVGTGVHLSSEFLLTNSCKWKGY